MADDDRSAQRGSFTLVELAEVSGVPARTIRFYIAKGLLPPPLVGGRAEGPQSPNPRDSALLLWRGVPERTGQNKEATGAGADLGANRLATGRRSE